MPQRRDVAPPSMSHYTEADLTFCSPLTVDVKSHATTTCIWIWFDPTHVDKPPANQIVLPLCKYGG